MNFKNKVVIVTGASRGIGKEIALLFGEKGATVIVNYVHAEKAALEVVLQIESMGATGIAVQCDVSDDKSVQAMMEQIHNTFGQIDILINNAGIVVDLPLKERTAEQFRRTLEVNVLGTFICAKYASDYMMQRGSGAIVNISSTNGINSLSPESIDYDVSKAGVINLTKNLAAEFAPNIRVNSVAPGWVNTDMNKELDPDFVSGETEKIALNRFATPVEIAKVVLFLASDDASYITGTTVVVDGGYR